MQIIIHTGHLSVDNGARAPLTQYFDLAGLLGVSPDTGGHYGDDSLEVDNTQWPIVEELLLGAKLLFKVKGVHGTWQNVRTEGVANRLRPVHH